MPRRDAGRGFALVSLPATAEVAREPRHDIAYRPPASGSTKKGIDAGPASRHDAGRVARGPQEKPMSLHAWIAFALASFLLGVVPGPGVLAIVGYAVGGGRRVALASVAGIALGNAVAMTLSLVGVGALLAASATAFAAVKWAGALYLVGLGIATLARSRGVPATAAAKPVSPRAAFLGNVLVGTFHPKTIVFFVAFVPQFVRADAPYAPQAALLVATFCGIVASTDTLYALGASRAARALARPGAALWTRRAEGGALIAAGVATAAAK